MNYNDIQDLEDGGQLADFLMFCDRKERYDTRNAAVDWESLYFERVRMPKGKMQGVILLVEL
jgi:hypothetical protein